MALREVSHACRFVLSCLVVLIWTFRSCVVVVVLSGLACVGAKLFGCFFPSTERHTQHYTHRQEANVFKCIRRADRDRHACQELSSARQAKKQSAVGISRANASRNISTLEGRSSRNKIRSRVPKSLMRGGPSRVFGLSHWTQTFIIDFWVVGRMSLFHRGRVSGEETGPREDLDSAGEHRARRFEFRKGVYSPEWSWAMTPT